jgi:hypothetical protein
MTFPQICVLAMFIVGMLLVLYGGIVFLITAFRESVWWGLGCLLLPLVNVIFLIMHWQETKKPFFIQLAGGVILLLAAWLGDSWS